MPSGLWSIMWQVSVQVLFEYDSTPDFGATTLTSKLTNRLPDTPELPAGTPCAVWHAEQEKPCWICVLCLAKLASELTLFKSWHLAHME